MADLLLTSTFALDRTKSKVLIVGLTSLSSAVLVIRSPRCAPFYITPNDWRLLSERLLRLNDSKRKEDSIILCGAHLQVCTTIRKQLVFSYHPSWIEKLLQTEAQSVTLSPVAANTLIALTKTIDSLLQKLQTLIDNKHHDDVVTSFDKNAVDGNMFMWQNGQNLYTPPSPSFGGGFYRPSDNDEETFPIQ